MEALYQFEEQINVFAELGNHMNMIVTSLAKSDEIVKVMVGFSNLAGTINVMHDNDFLLFTETTESVITDKDFLAAAAIESVVAFTFPFFDTTRQTDGVGRRDRVLATENAQSNLTALFTSLISPGAVYGAAIRTLRSAILCWLAAAYTKSFGSFLVPKFSPSCQARLTAHMVRLRGYPATINTDFVSLALKIKCMLVTRFGHMVYLQRHCTIL